MKKALDYSDCGVICRIGSLEILVSIIKLPQSVICRIGSLENIRASAAILSPVICRIGSLENMVDSGMT